MRTSSDISYRLRQLTSLALIAASSACADEDAGLSRKTLEGVTLVREDAGDRPLPNLDSEWESRFNAGDGLFEHRYFESQGLGPVYIRSSCGSCHENDARGPGAVRKMVMLDKDGVPLSDQSGLTWGNTIRPQTISGVETGIIAPEDGSLLITVRQPPAVFGRGYIEAIADSEIERVEAEQAERDDGISGRINWVTYTSHANPDTRFHAHLPGERMIGRFGLKARIATLDDFSADALLGDMGITSDLRPNELPNPEGDSDDRPGVDVVPETVNLLADYMRLLRIPSRKVADSDQHGRELFEEAQCGACHVPSLHTKADYALQPLADSDARVFSDLLLHDMGKGFGDEIHDFNATSTEWRTAPLLGLRFLRTYLHDGRAKSIEQAIELHGAPDSEAAGSVQHFRDLSDEDREALLAYVSAL